MIMICERRRATTRRRASKAAGSGSRPPASSAPRPEVRRSRRPGRRIPCGDRVRAPVHAVRQGRTRARSPPACPSRHRHRRRLHLRAMASPGRHSAQRIATTTRSASRRVRPVPRPARSTCPVQVRKGLGAAGAADQLARQGLAPHHAQEGRADQAGADDRDPAELRGAVAHWPTKLRSEATVARISLSRPMVTRRNSGRP